MPKSREQRRFLRRQYLILAAGFCVLLALVGTVVWIVDRQRAHHLAVRQSFSVDAGLAGLLVLLQEAETGQRGYLLTGDPAYLAPYEAAAAAVGEQVDAVAALTQDNPDHQQNIGSLRVLVERKLSELRRTVELRRDEDLQQALELVRSNVGMDTMRDVRSLIEGMREAEQTLLVRRIARADRSAQLLQIGALTAAAVVLLLACYAVLDSRRRTRHLLETQHELTESNRRLVGEMAAREAAESQVRQMQKIEALGQLTGGVAHDFNNMLAVVLGNLNLLSRRLERGDTAVQRFVAAALGACERAASLTSRLLAFARQQPLSPRVVDANRLVAGMSDLLRRSLGENIRIETVLAGGLWKTHADVSQLENAILNLAVNARDAMPHGGRLTIETANCHLDDGYAAANAGVPPGQYVLIAITDDGIGMAPEIMSRAFDPFFTTKPVGQGTGLGLSQVIGFTKQSGGHAKIYSEPGQGTTVKLYLPRFFGSEERPAPIAAAAPHPASRGELVLVVEDEARMRDLSVEALRELGYVVLAADSAAAALRLLDAHANVDLLFTDIVMPDMNGRKLAEAALDRRPGLKVLYTTGFTRNAVVHNGVLDAGVHFLAKPFTLEQLATKVREALAG